MFITALLCELHGKNADLKSVHVKAIQYYLKGLNQWFQLQYRKANVLHSLVIIKYAGIN